MEVVERARKASKRYGSGTLMQVEEAVQDRPYNQAGARAPD